METNNKTEKKVQGTETQEIKQSGQSKKLTNNEKNTLANLVYKRLNELLKEKEAFKDNEIVKTIVYEEAERLNEIKRKLD